MPKQPVSVTLDTDNLLWLRGRAASRKRRSLSDAIDEILTAARTGSGGLGEGRSVVGTIDIAASDPDLLQADLYVRSEVDASLARPLAVHEESRPYATAGAPKKAKRAGSPRARTRA